MPRLPRRFVVPSAMALSAISLAACGLTTAGPAHGFAPVTAVERVHSITPADVVLPARAAGVAPLFPLLPGAPDTTAFAPLSTLGLRDAADATPARSAKGAPPSSDAADTRSGDAASSAGGTRRTHRTAPPASTPPEVDCAKVKCVALTFDDGPGPHTKELLKTLKKEGAKATFFVLGEQAEQWPELVREEASAGMELGNHSWDHPFLRSMGKKEVASQISRTNAMIKKTSGGTEAVFLRPPYGAFSEKQRDEVSMPLALWDVDTLDWKTRSTRSTVKAASAARPGDIVLMHDIHAPTVKAVPQIVKNLKAKGYHLVTLSTLMGGRTKDHIAYGSGLRPDTPKKPAQGPARK